MQQVLTVMIGVDTGLRRYDGKKLVAITGVFLSQMTILHQAIAFRKDCSNDALPYCCLNAAGVPVYRSLVE